MWKKEFDTSFAGLTKDGAKWLVENTDIKLIGKAYYINIYIYINFLPILINILRKL